MNKGSTSVSGLVKRQYLQQSNDMDDQCQDVPVARHTSSLLYKRNLLVDLRLNPSGAARAKWARFGGGDGAVRTLRFRTAMSKSNAFQGLPSNEIPLNGGMDPVLPPSSDQ